MVDSAHDRGRGGLGYLRWNHSADPWRRDFCGGLVGEGGNVEGGEGGGGSVGVTGNGKFFGDRAGSLGYLRTGVGV
jgi:hypothetical protein